jgi:hypothetical protein
MHFVWYCNVTHDRNGGGIQKISSLKHVFSLPLCLWGLKISYLINIGLV